MYIFTCDVQVSARIEGLLGSRASSDAVFKIASDPGGIRNSSHLVRSLVTILTELSLLSVRVVDGSA